MNVVLPEPDGPMMQTVSPLLDVERDALEHLEAAEALVHVLACTHHDVGHRRHRAHARRIGQRRRTSLAEASARRHSVARPPAGARSAAWMKRPDRRQHEVPERDAEEVLDRLERVE